ncbi:MAG TPA: IS200/IS605 family transposase [Thermoanaerobaculia bacterium]|nr:IS200/IS605 family transposase [Thermoanaerobaculia bacterium]
MSYTNLLTHIVFSTKQRRPFLKNRELRSAAHAYLGGIVRSLKAKALVVGGVEDHVHMLVKLPASLAVADAMRVIKTNSSSWVRHRLPEFGWQTKYAAFSVSPSALTKVVAYIERQEAHHRKRSFQEELVELLEKNGVEYDERYLWV